MFERRFGIRAFDYWYGYSQCQIDLMVADQPVIDYNYKDRKGGSMMANKAEIQELDDLTAAWENKRKGKSFVGQTVDLADFVKGNI